jgi:DNA-binding LacI/PurR family transcriptional regulator
VTVVNTRKKSIKALQIKDLLAAAINKGKYSPGSYLPPERLLAAEFNVSRGTLRKSLELLREAGIVRINPGRGVRVVESDNIRRLRRFVVLQPDDFDFFSAGESMLFLKGIFAGAAACHAEMLMSFFPPDAPGPAIDKLISDYTAEHIDGVIFYECCSYEKLIQPLEKAQIPYVVGNLEDDSQAVCVKMDFRAIGREAGCYLIANGHRDIGILTGSLDSFIYREIAAGFRGALAEEEIPLPPDRIYECISHAATAEKECRRIMSASNRPTALFTVRDIRAAGCYAACAELGLRIPDDLSIISYDGLSWPEAKQKKLTLIEQPAEKIGQSAVEMLAEWHNSDVKPEFTIMPGVFRPGISVKKLQSK